MTDERKVTQVDGQNRGRGRERDMDRWRERGKERARGWTEERGVREQC